MKPNQNTKTKVLHKILFFLVISHRLPWGFWGVFFDTQIFPSLSLENLSLIFDHWPSLTFVNRSLGFVQSHCKNSPGVSMASPSSFCVFSLLALILATCGVSSSSALSSSLISSFLYIFFTGSYLLQHLADDLTSCPDPHPSPHLCCPLHCCHSHKLETQ